MEIVLKISCWALSFYFFVSAHIASGWPIVFDEKSAPLVLIALFLFLLPFAKSITVAHFFSFESKIANLKNEVHDFKEEVRNQLNLQTTLMSSISNNMTQQTNIHLPSTTDARKAERDIFDNNREITFPDENIISQYLLQYKNDQNLALARMRMDLEAKLRNILGYRTAVDKNTEIRFRSMRALWNEYFKQWPEQRYLLNGLRYVTDAANAAIHGQTVPTEIAEEAISIGLSILDALNSKHESVQSN